jgi:hypothetical protein
MWTSSSRRVADMLACEVCTSDYGLVPPAAGAEAGGGDAGGAGGDVRNARISALLEMGEAEAAQLADPAAGAPATLNETWCARNTTCIVLVMAATLVLVIMCLVSFPIGAEVQFSPFDAFKVFTVLALIAYAAAGCTALRGHRLVLYVLYTMRGCFECVLEYV